MATALLPDTLFNSVFRNMTKSPLYVPWAGGHGVNVPAGEHFQVLGDPRYLTPQVLGAQNTARCIMEMIKAGVIEFCSSPGQVLDDFIPTGSSTAIYSKSGEPVLENVPLDADELALRVLPVIVPVCGYDEDENEVAVDWHDADELDIHDKFTVSVTPPSGKPFQIKCGADRVATFTPKDGDGTYKVTVTLISLDGREQAGAEIDVDVIMI